MPKHVVVTGGTKGIGKEIGRQLTAKGYSVLIIGRDKIAGEKVKEEIKTQFPESSFEYLKGDLGSIDSAKKVVEEIQQHFSKIDILINNAGIWPTELVINDDGLEMGFMINHLAPLILSQGLLPQLQAAAPSRIVNVNAGLYIKGNLDLDLTPTGKDFHKIKTYMNTKLCNTLMTIELAEKLKEHSITVNALHPGVIRTNLGSFKGPLGWLLNVVKIFWATPSKGAEPIVWLGDSPTLDGISGHYFNKKEEMDLAENTKDISLRKALWNTSIELIHHS